MKVGIWRLGVVRFVQIDLLYHFFCLITNLSAPYDPHAYTMGWFSVVQRLVFFASKFFQVSESVSIFGGGVGIGRGVAATSITILNTSNKLITTNY